MKIDERRAAFLSYGKRVFLKKSQVKKRIRTSFIDESVNASQEKFEKIAAKKCAKNAKGAMNNNVLIAP